MLEMITSVLGRDSHSSVILEPGELRIDGQSLFPLFIGYERIDRIEIIWSDLIDEGLLNIHYTFREEKRTHEVASMPRICWDDMVNYLSGLEDVPKLVEVGKPISQIMNESKFKPVQ